MTPEVISLLHLISCFGLFLFFGPMEIWPSSLEAIPVFVNDTHWHCYSIQPRWRLSKRTTLKVKATLFFSQSHKILSSLSHLIWSNDHFFFGNALSMHCPLLITKDFHQKIQFILWLLLLLLELEMFLCKNRNTNTGKTCKCIMTKKVLIKLH